MFDDYLTEESDLPEGGGGGEEEECERDLDDECGQHTQPVHPVGLHGGRIPQMSRLSGLSHQMIEMIVPGERRGQTLGEVVGGHRAEAPPGLTSGGQLQGNNNDKFEVVT